MLDVERDEISGLISEDCGRLFCEFWVTKLQYYQVLNDITSKRQSLWLYGR